jgi:Flp pilus assembly protein TadD
MEKPPLAEIDILIDREPDRVDLLYLRAGLLARLGRADEARRDYMAVIAREPTHFGALNDLGSLLFATDFRTAARTAYAEAVKHHPDNPTGRINLANALMIDGYVEEARTQYDAALALAPDHPDALQGLANLLQDQGEAEAAEVLRQRSYGARTITTLPYRGAGAPVRVLLLVSAVGGNVPTRFLLDDRVFAVSVLVVEALAAAGELPAHELVFNAVGDADLSPGALDAAEAVLARTGAPVINPPARIRPTGRAAIAERLAGLAGVRTPRVVGANTADLEAAAHAFGFPLLLRSPGFHTGRHFVRVERAEALAGASAELPGAERLLIEPLDASDARGRFRKFRAMMIGGRIHPLHLAVSGDWKVHYFTADMAERAEHRAEEAAFLSDMAGVLGPRAMAGLAAIAERLGLDYGGVDFGLGPGGEVLVFEANATMVVNPPPDDPMWDYRRDAVDRVLAAARKFFVERAGAL